MWREVAVALLTPALLGAPAAADHGPSFEDVQCPTGSAQVVLDL